MSETVLYNNSGQTAVAASTLTINVSSNPAGAGNKKIIWVGAPIRDSAVATARTMTSVIYDGSLSLTSIVQQVNNGPMASRVAIFAANITGTGTGNIVATASAISFFKGVVIIADDLDQAAAAITAASNTLSDSASGAGLVVDGISNVANFTVAVDYALTEGGGQTEVTGCPLVDADGATNERNFSASYRTGGSGSQTMAWTSPNTRATHAVAIFPRVSGGTTPVNTSFAPVGTSTAAFTAKARALRSATMAGTSTLAITAIARNAVASTMAGTSTVTLSASARVALTAAMAGTSAMSVTAAARASTSLSMAGIAAMSVASASRASTALALAGTSTMTIQVEGGDFTAIPSRTFTQSRDRVYRGGRERVFSASARERVFT